jgi:hypothetical protein
LIVTKQDKDKCAVEKKMLEWFHKQILVALVPMAKKCFAPLYIFNYSQEYAININDYFTSS